MKKLKLLKKKSILHKKKTKKVSKNGNKKIHRKSHRRYRMQNGGKGESLSISYNGKSIANDSNITGIIDYSKAPQITINNSDMNKTYLITMTDPDAPNGIENKIGNFTYTHWVFTQINGKINETFLSYSPPSPPKGTHRYIFKLYDVSNVKKNDLNILKVDNNNPNRQTYFKTTLEQFISKKPLLPSFQFRVKA